MDKNEVKNCLAIVGQKKEEAARKMAIEIGKAMDEFVGETGVEIVGIQVALERLPVIGKPKIIISGVGIQLDL